MHHVRPYHFCKLKSSGFILFYESVIGLRGIVCFDLEDSINDSDARESGRLKDEQRGRVVGLYESAARLLDRPAIGVRINSPSTGYYLDDLLAVNSLKSIHTLFLPKVESKSDVVDFLRDLRTEVLNVVPVIETTKAFDGAAGIASISDPRVTAVAFGHCDFNMDGGFFPFFHQDSRQYWDWIRDLDGAVAPTGKTVINSPVLKLGDAPLFRRVLAGLKTFESVRGQITLCMKQTEMCAADSLMPTLPSSYPDGTPDPAAHAARIVDVFDRHRVSGKWFALDENREIVSPQEYSAAMRVLRNSGKQ